MTIDDKTRIELEAAAFRRLLNHLAQRTDVQNVDLMGYGGFCRKCLADWYKDAADAKGTPLSKNEAREAIYGMPYDDWRAQHQAPATPEQMDRMAASVAKNKAR